MKNPLRKRILRELRGDLGKYLVIFLFMIMLIGFVSAFLVAGDSMKKTYNEGFIKNNVEDGHFTFDKEPPAALLEKLAKEGNVKLYDLRYFQESLDGEQASIRVYTMRTEVNLTSLIDGKYPEADDEIAIDRLFARNRGISIGDDLSVNGRKLKVCGLAALPDYSCLFENNSDMMFDSVNFGVGLMTQSGFEAFDSAHVRYNYAWTFPEPVDRYDDVTAKKLSDEFLKVFGDVVKDSAKDVIKDIFTNEETKKDVILSLFGELKKQAEAEGTDISDYDNILGYAAIAAKVNSASKSGELTVELAKSYAQETGEDEEELKELFDGISFNVSAAEVMAAFKASPEEIEQAQKRMENISERFVEPSDFLPRYTNSAIIFTGNDIGQDRGSILIFAYLVIVVLAFIFAITASNTIVAEAGVIGTLRASGYTKGELIRHYMFLPMAVILVSAVVGNLLGYTLMVGLMTDMYMNSYSLAPFEPYFSTEALIDTTIIPIVLMFFINLFILVKKLRLSPLRFLRRDLSSRGNKKAFRLNTKIPIMVRFRMRVIFQNIPNYIILFFGIFLGGVLVAFSLMFPPMLNDYADLVSESLICPYQYVTAESAKTSEPSAEKYCMETLRTMDERFLLDDVSIFGIEDGSKYIHADIPEGTVIVNNGMSAKFGIKAGDTLTLKDPYSADSYTFKVSGVYKYDASLSLFMSRADFIKTFEKGEGYFSGYFSNAQITDIDDKDIYMCMTEQDFKKVTTQLMVSIGQFMYIVEVFGVVMFLLIMFILSKQIIEKNAKSISITKILGYRNVEIGGLYIVATSVVVVASLVISVPIIELSLRAIFSGLLYTEMRGYIPFAVPFWVYLVMVAMGIASYAAVAFVQMYKINRIPKADALKDSE